jgi:hypothetical protein
MKTNFKGTKGKWVIEKRKFETDVRTDTHRVCECKHYESQIDEKLLEPTKEEGMYNALLISKAPEMLEMLVRILEENNCTPDTDKAIEKLIKEVTEL